MRNGPVSPFETSLNSGEPVSEGELETDIEEEESPRPRKRRGKRRKWRIIAIVLAVLIGIPIAAAAAIYIYGAQTFNSAVTSLDKADSFPAEETRPEVTTSGALNYLIIGSDTRESLGDIVSAGFKGQRADTMMLVHIPADRQSISVVSFMRDLWVNIPGHGENKLNAALSYGGVPLVVETLESLTGVRIDHVAVADFKGFQAVTDELGGVDIYSDYAFESQNVTGFSFTKGLNHVNGEQALAFVRERYAFASADFQRVKNQQAYMKAVITAVLAPEVVGNPPQLLKVAKTALSYVAVDESFDFNAALGLAVELRNVRGDDIVLATAPTAGTGRSPSGSSIVLQNTEEFAAMSVALKDDSLADYLRVRSAEEGN
ncbi:hypothetical protein GCM10022198_22780 [Klugiella xanthotipulae]|uniref:LytR family transcriptional attenuator n=1 Tax=Klugiella xanthotipulae TaxID=244735 RepID=A0A543HYA3_9MICO|nr:LCP family protein [Klugiella xanthotipulae]TQM63322.1 LytR family transcriptional attenuator [Klugiella xanthotipulae]